MTDQEGDRLLFESRDSEGSEKKGMSPEAKLRVTGHIFQTPLNPESQIVSLLSEGLAIICFLYLHNGNIKGK